MRACDNCQRQLRPVFEGRPVVGQQFDNALIIKLDGGYGMMIDPIEQEYSALICHDCAVQLCESVPLFKRLIDPAHSHTHRAEDGDCFYSAQPN